jgi:hypothetical protein
MMTVGRDPQPFMDPNAIPNPTTTKIMNNNINIDTTASQACDSYIAAIFTMQGYMDYPDPGWEKSHAEIAYNTINLNVISGSAISVLDQPYTSVHDNVITGSGVRQGILIESILFDNPSSLPEPGSHHNEVFNNDLTGLSTAPSPIYGDDAMIRCDGYCNEFWGNLYPDPGPGKLLWWMTHSSFNNVVSNPVLSGSFNIANWQDDSGLNYLVPHINPTDPRPILECED